MSIFQRYLLPGFIFMAVVVGGGYSTGRELVQFFLPSGPVGGLMGMAVTMTVWSAVLAVSFELVRQTQSYDYKTFFEHLLGRGWVLYEIAYLVLLVLVFAVIGAAAGEVAHQSVGMPTLFGTLAMMGVIAVLVFYGSALIEKVLAFFALLLYGLYAAIAAWGLSAFGEQISASFAGATAGSDWMLAGLRYASYNVAAVPAVFFCLRHQTRRREALIAGLLAGPIAMTPGVLLYLTMMAWYPQIGEQPVPLNYLLGQFNAPWFQHLFQLVMFGILIKTGTALMHSINERVARWIEAGGRRAPRGWRPALSLLVLAVSVFAASAVGLVSLIAKGYGFLTYVFIALLVAPVLTVGLYRVAKTPPA